MMNLKVHLVFSGNCEEAFNTYREVFNGEIVFLFRKGDDKTAQVSDVEKNKIGHIVLNTEHFSLQGEDADAGTEVATGSGKLVLMFRDLKKLQQVFHVLSQGGTVVTPLEKTFYSEAIGEVIDKFGTRWEITMTDEDYAG
jgi:PhnB protein